MSQSEIGRAKVRLVISVIFFGFGVLYALFPIDFIPDFLGPIGWVDDLSLLGGSVIWAAVSFYKLYKLESVQSRR